MWRSMTAKCLSVCAKLPERQDISGKYMEQIIGVPTPKRSFAQRSRRAGRAIDLAKRPADITVGMILRATEGDLAQASAFR